MTNTGERLRRVHLWPGGPWLGARAIALTAPYSASIRPLIRILGPGEATLVLRDRRRFSPRPAKTR
jgi:hypothetical protein